MNEPTEEQVAVLAEALHQTAARNHNIGEGPPRAICSSPTAHSHRARAILAALPDGWRLTPDVPSAELVALREAGTFVEILAAAEAARSAASMAARERLRESIADAIHQAIVDGAGYLEPSYPDTVAARLLAEPAQEGEQ